MPARFFAVQSPILRVLRPRVGRRRGSVVVASDGWPRAGIGEARLNVARMPLQRIAWLVTVVGLLIGALIMLLSHYQGYAALFAAVAVSAAINLR
jgi:hypothetical protein